MPSTLFRGIWIFLLLVVAVASWVWMEDRNVQPAPESQKIEMAENQSDYYLEDFEIVNVSNQPGSVSSRYFQISGKSLSHHYPEGHSTIESPTVNLRNTEDDIWWAQAAQGRISADFNVLNLQGGVEVEHNQNSNRPQVSLTTPSIEIDAANRTMTTNDPVEVEGEGWRYSANKMRAEMDQGMLSFTDGVEAQYDNQK